VTVAVTAHVELEQLTLLDLRLLTLTVLSYCIGTMGAGDCLYAHVSIHNRINNTATPWITCTWSSQE